MATNSGCDQAARLEEQPKSEDRDRDRGGEADEGQAQDLPAQAREVDLQAGEESRKARPTVEKTWYRVVDVDPAERGGADEDPDHDLQHDRRQSQRGEEAERPTGRRSPRRR